MSLVNLGQSIISKTSKLKYRVLTPIEDLKAKFKVSCPNKDEIVRIIKKRNDLLQILNQLNNSIFVIDKTTKPLEPILKALNIAITTIKLLPAPTAVPGVTAGSLMLLADSLNIAKTSVSSFTTQIAAFKQIKAYILKTINDLKQSLQSLDLLINHCLEEAVKIDIENQNNSGNSILGQNNNIFNNESPITGSNLSINGVSLTEIAFINNQIGLTNNDSDILQQLESSENNEINSYNRFRFAILNDLSSTSKFPKRYAVAKTPSGVVLLKGESSFSSSVQVLIDELKFIIDRDDLKAF